MSNIQNISIPQILHSSLNYFTYPSTTYPKFNIHILSHPTKSSNYIIKIYQHSTFTNSNQFNIPSPNQPIILFLKPYSYYSPHSNTTINSYKIYYSHNSSPSFTHFINSSTLTPLPYSYN